MRRIRLIMTIGVILLWATGLNAQQQEWTLTDCIDFALGKNISVRKAEVSESLGEITLQQTKDNRLPSLNASAGESLGWQNTTDTDGVSTFSRSSRTSLSVNSSVTLFNGFQMQNEIKQADLNYKGLQYNTLQTRESVSLSIMNAYLQVLYSEEQVTVNRNQVEATTQELVLAKERMDLGAIANSDYLQVKTQLATEQNSLTNSINNLAINKVTLMQLMELPVSDTFEIARPDIEAIISSAAIADPSQVFAEALDIKPEIKAAAINRESAVVDLDIAKGGYYPTLSMSAGISSGFNEAVTMGSSLKDNFAPSIGLSASIPIFRNNQNKSNVSRAKANITSAELDELNTRNQLRKSIEQACLDARSAEASYESALNQYEASLESYNVAEEKFKLGAMNSVDFLIQKTNLASAESNLLQAKYELIYSYKIIDFYKGVPLSL